MDGWSKRKLYLSLGDSSCNFGIAGESMDAYTYPSSFFIPHSCIFYIFLKKQRKIENLTAGKQIHLLSLLIPETCLVLLL